MFLGRTELSEQLTFKAALPIKPEPGIHTEIFIGPLVEWIPLRLPFQAERQFNALVIRVPVECI